MSRRIVLRCEVDRLPPIEGADELALGLTWHLAWAEDFNAADDEHLLWVEPWCWQDAVAQVRICFFRDGAVVGTDDRAVVPIPADLTDAERAALHVPLHARTADLRSNVGAAAFLVDLRNPDAPQPEEGHVTQLQTTTQRTAGMLGYWLRLSAVVKVPVASLPVGMWDAANSRFFSNFQLFALPHLRIRSVAGIEPVFTGDASYRPDAAGPDAAGIWRYELLSGTGPALEGVVPQVDSVVADPQGRYIELKTGWVRSQLTDGGSTVNPPDSSVHWPTVVNDRVAESWDLARHLFDAVRDCVSIPTFDVYWSMIVAALRDRAGLGLLDTPDGEGLLKYALQLALPVGDKTVDVLVRQGALRSLQAKLRADEPISAGSGATDSKFAQWEAALRELFPALQKPTPSRTVTVTWPAGDPGVRFVLDAAAPAFDVRFFDGTADVKVNTAPVPGRRFTSADGGASFAFDAYDPVFAGPLRAGRYFAVTNDGTSEFPSARARVLAGVADDLAPLARAHTDLKRDENLVRLIRPVWGAHAGRRLVVADETASPAWYVSVFTQVAADPLVHVSAKTLGEIRPLDGRVWVLTVADLNYDAGNDVGCVTEFEFGVEYDLDGIPVPSTSGLVLRVEWKAGPAVELTWSTTDFSAAPAPIAPETPVTPTSVTAGDAVHLRVEFSRRSAAPLRLAAQAFLGTGVPGSIAWTAGPTVVVDAANLARLGLRLRNAAPADVALSAAPPTLLTASKSLAAADPEIRLLHDTWYADFDPGLRLWNQALEPSPDDRNVTKIDQKLAAIDVRELLTLGQIARFFPVWNKEWDVAHSDFLANIKAKFAELVKASVPQRFDRADHPLASSIYRDFEPRFDGGPLHGDVWKLVDDHLALVAQTPLPTTRAVDATGYCEKAQDRLPVAKSPPVQFQVDRPGTFADSNGDVDSDLLRKISGFGILLRQAPKAPAGAPAGPDDWFVDRPWSLVNCVDVGVLVENPPDPADVEDPYAPYPVPDALKLQAAPVPLQYQDNVRQTMISFENRHLMASSPLAEIADVFNVANSKPDALAPFLRRVPDAPASGHDWGLLPTLKYGQWYQALPFVLSNGGALPKPLADGHPARLRDASPLDAELPIHGPASDPDGDGRHDRPDYVRRFLYLRSVGIGAPRVAAFALPEPADSGSNSLSAVTPLPNAPPLPSTPRDVVPLARDWDIRGLNFTEPNLRFLYDPAARAGEIAATAAASWMLVLPRVAVCGAADTDAGGAEFAAAEFDLWIGLADRELQADPEQGCGLRIRRAADRLTVTLGASSTAVSLVTPAGAPLLSGPVDFRLAYAAGKLYLAWRRSDRDEPWIDWSPDGQVVGPAAAPTSACWIQVSRRDAALVSSGASPSVSGESTVTLGGPRFASGDVAVRNDRPVDDDLSLRDVALLDRQVTVFAPAKIDEDAVNSKSTAASILDRWSESFAGIAIRPPATDLATWTSWFDMDLHLGTTGHDVGGCHACPDSGDMADPCAACPECVRERVWTHHTLREGGSISTLDASIDDRAVDLLVLELCPLRTARKQPAVRISWVPKKNDGALTTPENLMREVQRKLRRLDIQVTSRVDGPAARKALAKALSVTPEAMSAQLERTRLTARAPQGGASTDGDAPLTARFQEQEIWELRIYPGVKNGYFTKTDDLARKTPGSRRFHSQFLEPILVRHDDPNNDADGDYRLAPPWRAVVEIATRDVVLPENDETDLDRQLVAGRETLLHSIVPRFDGSRIAVRLDKPAPWCFRYVSEIRLLRQVWRWRGRPVPPFPADAAAPTLIDAFPPDAAGPDPTPSELDAPDLPQLWDSAGFGDRTTIDLLDQTTGISAANGSANLYTESLAGDRRALYLRFGARASSRYASLFPGEQLECIASERVDWNDGRAAQPTKVANAWRRLFVPARRDEELPRPAVRFVVPLTEAEDDTRPSTTPGLLVVLDDAWYSYGGLAEALEAEISSASDYYRVNPGSEPVTSRPEFGPDPILTNRGWTKVDVGEAAEGDADEIEPPSKALSMQIVGPIGHTFDTGAEAPLYNATSFILRPPSVDPVHGVTAGQFDPWYGRTLAWYFAKVRFRRVLLPEATADYRTGPQTAITSTPQVFNFALAKDRGWVIDLPRIFITRDDGSGLDFTIAYESPALSGVVHVRRTNDALEILSGPADADLPNRALLIESAAWHEVELDVRVVHVLDEKTEPEVPGDTARKPQPRHTTLQYRIRAVRREAIATSAGDRLEPALQGRVWHLLERIYWASDADDAWPARWSLSAAGDVECAAPQALPARTSSYTAPQWVQFLPDSLLLRRLLTDDVDRAGRAANFQFRWLPKPSGADGPLRAQIRRRFGDDGAWTNVTERLSLHERAAFGKVIFRRFALLTELVADVRGQLGQERYLGLFKFVHDADPEKCLLDVTHRFPDVHADDMRLIPRLRIRIVEFQFVNSPAAAATDTLEFGPWSHLFADKPEPQTADAEARVVSVSPPIELLSARNE